MNVEFSREFLRISSRVQASIASLVVVQISGLYFHMSLLLCRNRMKQTPGKQEFFSTFVVALYPSEQAPKRFCGNCPFIFWSSSVTAHLAMFALSTVSLGLKRDPKLFANKLFEKK